MLKNFIITEFRKNHAGREFAVDMFLKAESADEILQKLYDKYPSEMVEKKFRVHEIHPREVR